MRRLLVVSLPLVGLSILGAPPAGADLPTVPDRICVSHPIFPHPYYPPTCIPLR